VSSLETAWSSPEQRDRCLEGLVADGLVEPVGHRRYTLPGCPT
jgi:A/G-specific adenine glycosylase